MTDAMIEFIRLYEDNKGEMLFWKTKEINDYPHHIQLTLKKMAGLYNDCTQDEKWRLHRPKDFNQEILEEVATYTWPRIKK